MKPLIRYILLYLLTELILIPEIAHFSVPYTNTSVSDMVEEGFQDSPGSVPMCIVLTRVEEVSRSPT